MSDRWLELGRLGRPYGLQGWLHCESFADPEENLLRYRHWRLRLANGTEQDVELAAGRAHSGGWVVKLEGLENPESTQDLAGATVWVARAELPPPPPGEFYRADLVGLRVRNQEGEALGQIEYFIDGPANVVMVVRGEREHWVPVSAQHLLKVDLVAREVLVDWPADF